MPSPTTRPFRKKTIPGARKQTKAQLLAELTALRQRVATLEAEVVERKEREAPLQEREARYRDLVENATDAIATFTVEQIITNVNRGAEMLLGWRREDLIGQHVLKVATPASVVLAEDRARRSLAGEKLPRTFEVELIRKDGTRVIVEARTRVIRDQEGKPAGFHGIYQDITERKKAEEQFRAEAEIAAALARVGQEMIASLNTPTILERLCRLTTEVLECDCSHTTLWEPHGAIARTVAGYGDTSEQWETIRMLKVPTQGMADFAARLEKEGVIEFRMKDTPQSMYEAVLAQFGVTSSLFMALRHGQEFIGVQSAAYRGRGGGFSPRQKRIAQGIAQIASLALANARLLEELERSNRLKEDFVGTMSHEFRTPLHILLGYLEMLRDQTYGPLTSEQANILCRVDKSTQELLELINATLDLSRLQSRRVPLTVHEVRVSQLMAELEAEIRQLNHKPTLQQVWRMAFRVPLLHTDAVKLKMVLKNLITNALKFTGKGTVSISATSQGEGVAFIIADTGQGIAPEILPFIFEPFRQGESLATRRQGGVGLGLYIVRQLLTLLGGTISVKSEVGRGTTFRVWIPQVPKS